MPERKEKEPPSTEVIRVRIPIKTKIECLKAKEAGLHWHDAESSFFGYLLELGLKHYQKVILPAELSTDEPLLTNEKTPEYNAMNRAKQKYNEKKAKRA